MNSSPHEDPLTHVTEEQWADAWIKLRLHTWKKYRWLHDKTGEDLDDIAHQAIVDTWSGKRRWPPIDRLTRLPKKDISLLYFLCETVRSIVSHRWAKTKTTLPSDNLDSITNGPQFEKAFAHPTSLVLKPGDIEEAEQYKRLTDRMLDIVEDDNEVFQIVKLLRVYPDLRPREIAKILSITMPQMRAAQKRLRRLLGDNRKVQHE